jgi:hypothetical protein
LYYYICLSIFIEFQTIITQEYFYKAAETYDIGLEVDDQTKHDENENGIYYMERPQARLKLLHIFLLRCTYSSLLVFFVTVFSPLE